MRAILVDDEPLAITQFLHECKDLHTLQQLDTFTDAGKALEFAYANPIDLALLDIQMSDINGIDLGRQLLKIHPKIQLIFVTADPNFALDAFQMKAVSYVLKPYYREDIADAIIRANLLSETKSKDVQIRTFGYFDVFINGQPMKFSRSKSKELLALLVDHNGGTVSMELAISYLWEDRALTPAVKSSYRAALKDLRRNLSEEHIEHIFINAHNAKSIDVAKIDCDYFRFLQGDPHALTAFNGEYMSNYSWGESTLGHLVEIQQKFLTNNPK